MPAQDGRIRCRRPLVLPGDRPGRYGEDERDAGEPRDREPDEPRSVRTVREPERRNEDRGEPERATDGQCTNRRGGGDAERDGSARRCAVGQKRRHEGRDQCDERSRHHLLDAAPEGVADERRGLRRNDRYESSQAGVANQPGRQRVDRKRDHRSQEREVRRDEPGHILVQELATDPEWQERGDRVADAEGRLERDLIGRVGEAGQAASVDHDAVGERQPLGTVVELDPPRPGRAARQQNGCTEREERPECGRRRPPTRLRATPGKDEQSPCHSDGYDCRSGELRGASAHRQQLCDDDHRRKPRRKQQRPRNAPAGHRSHHKATTERKHRQDKGEDHPCHQQPVHSS